MAQSASPPFSQYWSFEPTAVAAPIQITFDQPLDLMVFNTSIGLYIASTLAELTIDPAGTGRKNGRILVPAAAANWSVPGFPEFAATLWVAKFNPGDADTKFYLYGRRNP